MRRSLLLLTLAVAVGLGLRLLLGTSDEERGGEAASQTPTVTPQDVERPDVDLIAAPADQGDIGRTEVPEIPTGGFAAQPDEGLRVRVVARENGEVVPDPIVYVIAADAFEAPPGRRGGLNSARKGERFRGSLEGTATVPAPSSTIVVAAETDDRFGFVEVPAGADAVTVEVDHFPSVTVRVVDEAGAPVEGMLVALRRRTDPPYDSKRHTTDERGEVVFDDVLAVVKPGSRYGYGVALVIPTARQVEFELDPDALPTEPVELVAPQLGSLAVRVFGLDGEPLSMSGARVNAVARDVDDPVNSEYGHMPYGANAGSVMVVDGVATFPFVAPNQRYELSFSSSSSRKSETMEAYGPERAGETRTVDYHPLAGTTIVSMRLLDPAGEPYTRKWVDAVLRIASPPEARLAKITTDANGRFEQQLDLGWSPGQTRTLEILADDSRLGADVDLSRAFKPGNHDLGDVQLVAPPIGLSGVVRRRDGSPAGSVYIRINVRSNSRDGRMWRPFQRPTLRAERDGTFELRGWFADSARLELNINSSKYELREPLEVDLGTQDIVLIVDERPDAVIRGQILADDGIAPELFRLTAMLDDRTPQRHSATRSPGGAFEFRQLEDRPYRIRVEAEGVEGDLLTIDGVRAVEKTDPMDPRLDPLDLRGLVSVVRLDVSNVAGEAIPSLQVRYRPSGQRSRWHTRLIEGSRKVLLLTKTRLDIDLSAAGYRTESLVSVAGERTVVMRAGYPVRISLIGGRPGELTDADSIHVKLRDLTRDGQELFQQHLEIDENGELFFAASRTGIFTVLTFAQRTSESGARHMIGIGLTDPDKIQIVDSPGEQRFQLGLDRDRLRNALDAFEPKY